MLIAKEERDPSSSFLPSFSPFYDGVTRENGWTDGRDESDERRKKNAVRPSTEKDDDGFLDGRFYPFGNRSSSPFSGLFTSSAYDSYLFYPSS